MAHYQTEWPLLILCPASLRHTWPAEIETFLPEIPPAAVYVVSGFDDADFFSRRTSLQIVIATYSLLQTRSAAAKVLAKFQFKCVIADESHSLKERTSQRCQLGLPILENAKRLVLLSGTPALSRPVELWAQIQCIAPNLFGSYNVYTKQYCNARRGRFGYDVSGLSNAEELHQKLRQIMVRRLKSHVLKELPPKQRSIIPIKISADNIKTCKDLMTDLKETRLLVDDLFGHDAASAHFEARHLLMMAYQQSGIAKAKSVADFLLDWLTGSGTQKILVFAHHKDVMDVLEKAMAKKFKGIGHVRIDGSVLPKERAIRVKKFQTLPIIRVAILSMTAAGVGLTLTAASSVMFAELHWTPGVLVQAEDRCHRIGQVNAVNVMYAVCKDEDMSVDMSLWRMLGRKVGNLGKVIDGCRDASMGAKIKSEGDSTGCAYESAQDELTRFFAEVSSVVTKSPDLPVKGSIMSFFKSATSASPLQDCSAKSSATLATAETPRLFSDRVHDKPSANPSPVDPSKANIPYNAETVVTWSCDACTFLNCKIRAKSGYLACDVCRTPYLEDLYVSVRIVTPTIVSTTRQSSLKVSCNDEQSLRGEKCINETPVLNLSSTFTNNVVCIDDNDSDVEMTSSATAANECTPSILFGSSQNNDVHLLKFSVSKNSGRVTIHNAKTDESFFVSFDTVDIISDTVSIKALTGPVKRSHSTSIQLEFNDLSIEALLQPVVRTISLGKDSQSSIRTNCVELVKQFCQNYSTLREIEKKKLQESGLAFFAQDLRQNVAKLCAYSLTLSTERYVGGAKERSLERVEQGTETDADKSVLEGYACAWCAENLPSTSLARGVQATYCSQKCVDEGRLKRGGMFSSSRVREQIFALEGGVCCRCRRNAHALYTRLFGLQPSERLNVLAHANWGLPKSSTALERLLQHPTEGDFWQADHIVPVIEGGGGCDLGNLQTLCTPCHRIETGKLRARMKLGGGTMEIENGAARKRKQMDIRSSFVADKRS